jgi:hypothetical protein
MFNIARASSMTFEGIDYTFRNAMNLLFGLNQKSKQQNEGEDKKIEISQNMNKLPKKKLEIENHIKDLENTMKINQEYIYNIILVLPIKQNNKKKLIDTLERIKLLFNEKKKYRKEGVDISSKILINKQIIEEIKRRYNENIIFQNDKISNFKENVNKKTILVKNILKKFNELEIFVQRECVYPENIEKYGKWKTFTVIPFMKKNEFLLKKKKIYEIDNKSKKNLLAQINAETNFIKQSKNIRINFTERNTFIKYNLNLIHNYYLNIFSIRKNEIELLKTLGHLLVGKKYNDKKMVINEIIFENNNNNSNYNDKFLSGEKIINKEDEKTKSDEINIEKNFSFIMNEKDIKDLKEISDNHNYWIDSDPEEI